MLIISRSSNDNSSLSATRCSSGSDLYQHSQGISTGEASDMAEDLQDEEFSQATKDVYVLSFFNVFLILVYGNDKQYIRTNLKLCKRYRPSVITENKKL